MVIIVAIINYLFEKQINEFEASLRLFLLLDRPELKSNLLLSCHLLGLNRLSCKSNLFLRFDAIYEIPVRVSLDPSLFQYVKSLVYRHCIIFFDKELS